MIEIVLDARTCEEHRDVLMEWARANDLDPAEIPEGATVVIDGGTMTLDVQERDGDGKPMLDPFEPNAIKTVKRTVPIKAPWPLVPGPKWVRRG